MIPTGLHLTPTQHSLCSTPGSPEENDGGGGGVSKDLQYLWKGIWIGEKQKEFEMEQKFHLNSLLLLFFFQMGLLTETEEKNIALPWFHSSFLPKVEKKL